MSKVIITATILFTLFVLSASNDSVPTENITFDEYVAATESNANETPAPQSTCLNQFDFVSLEKTVYFEDDTAMYIYNIDDYHYFYSSEEVSVDQSHCADDWTFWHVDTVLKY